MQQGPTGNRLAANIRAVRKHRAYDLKAVSEWLTEMGRPININGLSKIENGQRRVDADDLIAIALVLDVTPDRLLIGPDSGDEEVVLTPTFGAAARRVWKWVVGETSLRRETAKEAWRALVRPDSPSLPGVIRLPSGGLDNPVVKEAMDLFSRAETEGIDLNGLVAFYELRQPAGDGNG